ncbi:hypothetical protein LTR62_000833 [Meristemomyces frigidus]|uniref:Vacuolar segregation protein 7 n=1 Tax=Meristemomyces frigidus TaxID=1508187 RepID=A0AAN7TNM6_9PEZI|nr:hypothetical protein LTR62_000833 [Meristemomyces frigidus]
MASGEPTSQSLTGRMESAEPAASGGKKSGSGTSTARSSAVLDGTGSTGNESPKRQMSASSLRTSSVPPLRKQRSSNLLPTSASPSAGTSPQTSRNNSPQRKDSRSTPLTTPLATQPSAASIQRALSAANVPQIQPAGPVTEAVSRLPRTTKGTGLDSGESTPKWPISPRLKSPPPTAVSSRRGSAISQKKVEPAPSISVQAPQAQTATPPSKASSEEAHKPDQQLQAPPKVPSRGPSGKSTLETVQENSTDSIPETSAALQATADLKPLTKITEEVTVTGRKEGQDGEKHTVHGESGSESAGSKMDKQRGRRLSLTSTQKNGSRPPNPSKGSFTPLQSAKARQAEGKQNMTVETETVPSIPQSGLGTADRVGSGRVDASGSVRLKPSTETIRPKKERKKPTQKTRSMNQGTASSKADIFEQRVASAVEQENTSDSDETFVYESNPPEPQRRTRHHSRTPSVTSAHSTTDQSRGIRNFGELIDEQRRVNGKRSMKFSNNPYNDTDSPEGRSGTVRSHQARHFGKIGRGGSQASIYDPESPFTKIRNNHLGGMRQSRPNSPRSPQSLVQRDAAQQRPSALFNGHKAEHSFDFDGEGADDERTPLVGTVRATRNSRHTRNLSDSIQNIDEYYGVPQRRSRCGPCTIALGVLLTVVLSAIVFMLMSNRPLFEVQIRKIQNVLASEQELMLDLFVEAVNPNALSITVADLDLNVFAKSKHVGRSADYLTSSTSQSSRARRRDRRSGQRAVSDARDGNPNPWQDLTGHWHAPSSNNNNNNNNNEDDHHDHGTGPSDPDPEIDAQTLLLGRILHFDQPLTFEGSPIKRHEHFAIGELRLQRPGNKTEVGGSARWEKVVQHPFELIVRGVLRYQLPVSARVVAVGVGTSVVVHPEDPVGREGRGMVGKQGGSGGLRLREIEEEDGWEA